jgi:plastocyanin
MDFMATQPLDSPAQSSHHDRPREISLSSGAAVTGAARALRLGWLVAPFAVALAVVGVSPASAAPQQVQVVDTAFEAPAVAVTPGETVTWNKGPTGDAHNVHFEDEGLEFPREPTSAPFTTERNFPTTGEFRYFCDEHGGFGGSGMSGIVYVNATGTVPGDAPTASFTATPSDARTGQTVNFNASETRDTDGTIIRHEWDLDGNGSLETDTGAFPMTSRAYPTAGVRTVKLRVTDSQMRTNVTTRSVTVTSPPPITTDPPPANPLPTNPPPATQPQADTLSREIRILSSKRLGRILRRGLRFEAAAPVNGATLRASLSAGGRALGSVRRTGLSRGRVKVTLKLSRRGKTRLKRLLAAKPRAKALLKVAAGGETNRARFTIRR